MIFIEIDKKKKLKSRQVEKSIAFIFRDKFFDCFGYMKEDAIWWSFNIKNLIHDGTERLRIWIKKRCFAYKYYKQARCKRTDNLRLPNSQEDYKGEKEDHSA